MSALSISSISSTGRFVGLERLPQFAGHDVIGDVVDPFVAELAVAQPRHRVVFVKPLLRLGGRFDVPGDQVLADAAGDLMGEDGLAGAGLAFDQQRPFERDRGVDRDLQIRCRDIALGALETPHAGCVLCQFRDPITRGAA